MILPFVPIHKSRVCKRAELFHAWPQGHNLNKLGRAPQGDATFKHQDSRPCVFRKEDFFMFSNLAYVSYVTPGAGP